MDGNARGQSELIGVILLAGIIVILSMAVGTVAISNLSSQAAADPLVDIGANATTQRVTIQHMGGENLAVSDVTVILRGENSERYPLETFTQQSGDDTTQFEPGDEWQRSHGVTGDQMTILLVDEKANAIIDTTTVPITVTIGARFSTSPRYPREDETVTFTASESTVAGSTLTSYEWEFGDGTTGSGETVNHTYTENGSYLVNLTVTAADGRVANRTKTVRIYNEAPNPSFTYTPTNPDPGKPVSFDASGSSDPDGTIERYDWEFGDGTNGTGETINHSYGSEGNYTVWLEVTDNDGATRRTSQVVEVKSASAPAVTITSTSISSTGQSGQYDVDVTFEASDSDGNIANYTAYLYNSSSQTTELDNVSSANYDGATTTVTLIDDDANAGESPLYVLVKVGDSTNRVGNDSTTVVARNDAPTAIFTYSPGNPSPNQPITFNASESSDPNGDALSYDWDFDDGTTGTGETTTHTYASSGSYDVSLTVDDGKGGVNTTTKTVSALTSNPAGFTSVSASNISKGNSATQTLSFTPNQTLPNGETVDIDLSSAQSVDSNSNKSDPVDYREASVSNSPTGGNAKFSTRTSTDAVVTYTASEDVSSGTPVTIDITNIDAKQPSGKSPDSFDAIFIRRDGTTESTTFTITN